MRLKLFVLFIFISISAISQDDNNSSISEELKNIWETDASSYLNASDIRNFSGIETDPSLPNDNTQTDAPIDGGLGFLLAAGAGYVANGLNRKRRRRKNNSVEETSTNNQ